MKKQPCHCCHGSGVEENPKEEISRLVALRIKTRAQKEVAREMRVTQGYLCMLENGTRPWSSHWLMRYKSVLGGTVE